MIKLYKAMAVGILAACLGTTNAIAQSDNGEDTTVNIEIIPLKTKKFYMGNSFDAGIFSTATIQRPLQSDALGTLRFSYVINFGFNFHYDFSKHVGLFTGLGIKNIGFIEKIKANDSTVKRRVYALGIPLGIKFGGLSNRKYGFIGGGADLALNYREKGFIKRGDKEKFNEWFSDRTPLIMPYLFAGVSLNPGLVIKAQYYPINFMNEDFTQQVGTLSVKPYSGYKVNLIMLSIGMDIHYNKKPKERFKEMKKMI